ncbi:MAG: hypothetical protein KC618_00055 [Candidatus Omnitrophica bacterium]|nr:hypothetical protein [Candidatus Omnitrophota bacterium]
MLRKLRQGQSTLEYLVLIIVILGAFLAMQLYFRRGIQGRWKSTLDDLGDQYDPRFANTRVRHTLITTTDTQIIAHDTTDGTWTERIDNTNSVERKTGYMSVDSY